MASYNRKAHTVHSFIQSSQPRHIRSIPSADQHPQEPPNFISSAKLTVHIMGEEGINLEKYLEALVYYNLCAEL